MSKNTKLEFGINLIVNPDGVYLQLDTNSYVEGSGNTLSDAFDEFVKNYNQVVINEYKIPIGSVDDRWENNIKIKELDNGVYLAYIPNTNFRSEKFTIKESLIDLCNMVKLSTSTKEFIEKESSRYVTSGCHKGKNSEG